MCSLLSNIEWRQSRESASPQDIARHSWQHFSGEEWSATASTLQQMKEQCQKGEFYGQGHWPLQADKWRGQARACVAWLQAHGLHPASDSSWQQGHALPYLASFQEQMIREGVPAEIFADFQDAQLTQAMQDAAPVGPDGQELTPEEFQEAQERLCPVVKRRNQGI